MTADMLFSSSGSCMRSTRAMAWHWAYVVQVEAFGGFGLDADLVMSMPEQVGYPGAHFAGNGNDLGCNQHQRGVNVHDAVAGALQLYESQIKEDGGVRRLSSVGRREGRKLPMSRPASCLPYIPARRFFLRCLALPFDSAEFSRQIGDSLVETSAGASCLPTRDSPQSRSLGPQAAPRLRPHDRYFPFRSCGSFALKSCQSGLRASCTRHSVLDKQPELNHP